MEKPPMEKMDIEEGASLLSDNTTASVVPSQSTNDSTMNTAKSVGGGARKAPQYIAASAVNIACVAAGLALGWPSPSTVKLKDIDESPLGIPITSSQESWIGSLIALGAACGPFAAGIACDKIGRKMTLLVSTVPFIVAWFIIATTCNITQIYAARFLMGTGVGAIFTALPMYVGELSDDSLRGSLGSFLQLFIVTGILLAYLIGPYISFVWFAVICFAFPVIFICVFITFPDSPAYLIQTGRKEEAREALKKLRGLENQALEKEIALLQNSIDEAMKNQGSFATILQNKGNRKALILTLALMAGQQFGGINVVLFYTQSIFEATGSTIPGDVSAIIIGTVQVVASLVTPMIVEKAGRKLLFLVSAAGMCLGLFTLGLFFHLKASGMDVTGISFLPVVSLVFYIIVYCLGFGPLPWAVMGELFPANIKSVASTISASSCWLMGFLITKFFADIAAVIGMSGAFWLFSAFCVASGAFVYMFLPETKGKSLQEIQDILNGNSD